MRLNSLAAAIATLLTFSTPSAFGGDSSETIHTVLPAPCTPQAQRCLEKLSTLIDAQRRSSEPSRTGRGWHDLIETNPECAIELGGIGY
jgi:hypothetical protein